MNGFVEIQPEMLHEAFDYYPETGWLISKVDHPQRKRGDVVGCVDTYGYAVTTIHGIGVKVHRIVWAMVHGEWPNGMIDHINGNTLDNRITNLRVVCKSKNSMNSKVRADNVSGTRGVVWRQDKNRWKAYITKDQKQIHLGYFERKDAAIDCRKQAEKLYFGEFARVA